MTDDDTRARFEEITSGEELAELRDAGKPRRQWMHGVVLAAAWVLLVAAVVCALVYLVVWLGHHGVLPAPK